MSSGSRGWPRLAGAERALRARFAPRTRGAAFEVGFAVAVALTLVPLFAARYLPIQDLPQHAAAVRVLHDFANAELGFARYFERSLAATQYLSVYLLADVLAYAFGAVVALKIVIGLSLAGLPYALRSLLSALGRPASYALLALPLAYNTQLVLGFLNFVAGLPLMIWGLALAVRRRLDADRDAGFRLAAVALLCFFTHVVPYGFLMLGVGLTALGREPRRVLAGLAPLAPSFACAVIWLARSPAGRSLVELVESGAMAPELDLRARIGELSFWLTDVLPGRGDELWAALVCALGVALFFIGRREDGGPRAALGRRLVLLSPIAALAYFVLPASFGFIWPIHGRFALLALLFGVFVLPRAAGIVRASVALLALALTLVSTTAVTSAFRASERDETGALRELIAEIPLGSRVLGLMFDRSSRHVNFSPYLHAVAWVQAERGGAVMFSFADFPASPFRFREDARPPRVPPRWEWLPEHVDARRIPAFYDHVLARAPRTAFPGWSLVVERAGWLLLRRQPTPP